MEGRGAGGQLQGQVGGRVGRPEPVVGWEGRQGGLAGPAHAQGHGHGVADVQRLVDREAPQALGLEVAGGQQGL